MARLEKLNQLHIFEKYGKLQLVVLSRIVSVLAILYLTTFVLFAILRLFTGVSIKRIGYFSLRYIAFSPKSGMEVRVGNLGLSFHRPTVARPGWVTLHVINCEVVVDLKAIIDEEAAEIAREMAHPSTSHSNNSSNSPSSAKQQPKEDPLAAFDQLKSLPLVSKKNKPLFKLVQWLLPRLKFMEINLTSISLTYTGVATLVMGHADYRIDTRNLRTLETNGFVGTLDAYKLARHEMIVASKLRISDVYLANSLDDEDPIQILDYITLTLTGVLSKRDLGIKELSLALTGGRITLRSRRFVEALETVRKHRVEARTKAGVPCEPRKQSVLSQVDRQRLAKTGLVLVYLVKQIEFKVASFEISELPTPHPAYHDKREVTLAASMSDFNLEVRRINPQSPSFKLLYDPGDSAHQGLFTVASINFGIDNGVRKEELLYVPMVTVLTKTNTVSRTLKLVHDEEGANKSVVRMQVNISSPNVNIEMHQLPILLQMFGSNKFASPDTPARNTEPWKVRVPLQNLLPRTDINLTIQDPALRLVVDENDSMFIWSGARISSHCHSTHSTLDTSEGQVNVYEVDATVEATHARAWYRSDQIEHFDICTSNNIRFAVSAKTQPELTVAVTGKVTAVQFKLLQAEIFHKIRMLYISVGQDQLQRRAEKKMASSPRPKLLPLRKLPAWLVTFNINLSDISLAIASDRFRRQHHNLLGLEFALKTLVLNYTRDFEAPSKYFTDGRRAHLTASTFVLSRVSNAYVEHTMDDNMRKQAVLLEMPVLEAEAVTCTLHDKPALKLHMDLPDLVADININQLLAAMVLREVIDHAMGNDLRRKATANLEKNSKESDHPDTVIRIVEHPILSANLGNVRFKIDLPSENRVMIELTKAHLSYASGSNPSLQAGALRLYSRYPFYRAAWCIILSMVDVKLEFNMDKSEKDRILADIAGVRINVPFKFKLYRIIDSGITMAKAIKTLIEQTKLGDPLMILQPNEIKGIPPIPLIRLRTKSLLLGLEDDHFEADLNLIFKTGAIAQQARSQMELLLEDRIKKVIERFAKQYSEQVSQELASAANEYVDGEEDSEFFASSVTSAAHSRATSRGPSIEIERPGHERPIAPTVKHAATFSQGDNDHPGIASTKEHLKEHMPRASTFRSERSERSERSDRSDRGDRGDRDDRLRPPRICRTTSFLKGGMQRPATAPTGQSTHTRNSSNGSSAQHNHSFLRRLLDTPLEMGHNATRKGSQTPWYHFWNSDDYKHIHNEEIEWSLDDIDDEDACTMVTLAEVRHRLLKHFERSWYRLINGAKDDQRTGVAHKLSQPVPDVLDKETCENEMIVGYSEQPLLMSAQFKDTELHLGRTHFDVDQLRDFMYKVGKGVPKDSRYSIMVPLYIDIRAQGGLRVDLRDYPLPVLELPALAPSQDPKISALRVYGEFVISEQLVNSERNIRPLFVPLQNVPSDIAHKRSVEVIEVHRTLAPAKIYTNLKFESNTTRPSRVTWCSAYKPAFALMQQGFSNFSKPPIDLSPELGFWDKIRLVLHARMEFNLPNSPLYFLLKAGRDPYAITGDDAGFAFVWKQNVRVLVNESDEPKNLLVVDSKVFETIVPNFITWETEYLSCAPGQRGAGFRTNYDAMDQAAKVVMRFSDATQWKMGMMFERQVPDSIDRTKSFRHHYDIQLSMPNFVKDVKDYDAYRGFRSDYVFMAVSVHSCAESSMNSVYLTPGVFRHFKYWKEQFKSVLWPPLRSGSLFPGESDTKAKFSSVLSGAQYQLLLSPLYLSFVQETIRPGRQSANDTYTGLKARVSKFVMDIHTRREPQPGSKRWHMATYLGEVDVKDTDVRTVFAKIRRHGTTGKPGKPGQTSRLRPQMSPPESFNSSSRQLFPRGAPSIAHSTQTGATPSFASFPDSAQAREWSDIEDFVEIGMLLGRVSSADIPKVEILPFVFSPQFTYMRQTDHSGSPYGTHDGKRYLKFGKNEVVHDCLLERKHPAFTQLQLLKRHRTELNERMADVQAMLDSLRTQPDRTRALQEKEENTARLVDVIKASQNRIDEEIKRCQEAFLGAVADQWRGYAMDISSIRKKQKSDPSSGSDKPLASKLATEGRGVLRELRKKKATEDRDSSEAAEQSDPKSGSNSEPPQLHANSEAKPEPSERSEVQNGSERTVSSNPASDRTSEDTRTDATSGTITGKTEQDRRAGNGNYDPEDDLWTQSDDSDEPVRGFNPDSKTQREFKLESSEEVVSPQSHSQFNNRFMIYAVHAKWNNKVRDRIFRLKLAFSLNREVEHNRCRHAVEYIEELVRKAEEQAKNMKNGHDKTKKSLNEEDEEANEADPPCANGYGDPHVTSSKRLETFVNDLVKVPESCCLESSYLVRFLTPQIQMVSDKNPTKSVQIAARDVDVRIVSVYDKDRVEDETAFVEKRYGALIDHASAFVLSEKDQILYDIGALSTNPYIMRGASPINSTSLGHAAPWLALDLCYSSDALNQFKIVKNVDLAFRHDKPNQLHVSKNGPKSAPRTGKDASTSKSASTSQSGQNGQNGSAATDAKDPANVTTKGPTPFDHSRGDCADDATVRARFMVDSPRILVACDSVQFYTAYMIGHDLLAYKDPVEKEHNKVIERVMLSTDFSSDFQSLISHLNQLQQDINALRTIHSKFFIRRELYRASKAIGHEPSQDTSTRDIVKVENEYHKAALELLVVMRAFKAGLRRAIKSTTVSYSKWSVLVDEIVGHILNEHGKPFLDMGLARTHFSQVSSEGQFSLRRVEVGMLQGWNLMPDAIYPEIIAPYKKFDKNKPMAAIQWTDLDPVGGIPIVEEVDVRVQPMKIQLERVTADKIMDFAFPVRKESQQEDANSKNESDSDDSSSDSSSSNSDAESLKSGKPHEEGPRSKLGRWLRLRGPHETEPSASREINEMVDRASNYTNIIRFTIHNTTLCMSYKGRSKSNWLDLQDVVIPLPELRYRNKMWTKLDLAMRLKKDVIKILVGHSGTILSNRFRRHKGPKEPPHHAIQPMDHYHPLERINSNGSALSEMLAPVRTISRRFSHPSNRLLLPEYQRRDSAKQMAEEAEQAVRRVLDPSILSRQHPRNHSGHTDDPSDDPPLEHNGKARRSWAQDSDRKATDTVQGYGSSGDVSEISDITAGSPKDSDIEDLDDKRDGPANPMDKLTQPTPPTTSQSGHEQSQAKTPRKTSHTHSLFRSSSPAPSDRSTSTMSRARQLRSSLSFTRSSPSRKERTPNKHNKVSEFFHKLAK